LVNKTEMQKIVCKNLAYKGIIWQIFDFNIVQVYFKMLDTLLAEEQMPDEYSGKTQVDVA